MENLNKKEIAAWALGLLALGGIGLYFYQPTTKTANSNGEKDKVEMGVEKNRIESFFRTDLNDAEKENLKILLAQRDEKLKQIKNILDEAYKTGDMENAWLEANKIRDEIKSSLLPYVAEDKRADFEAFCYQQAEAFDANYVQK